MASLNAEAVAKDVIETVRKGKKVNFQKLQKKHGYTDASARAMKVKKTKTFQKRIAPLVDRLKSEIDRIQLEMSNRDITDEKYIELAKVMDIYIKNYQLFTGGDTERSRIVFMPNELNAKYADKFH